MKLVEERLAELASAELYVGSLQNLGLSYYVFLYHLLASDHVVHDEFVFFNVWSGSHPPHLKHVDQLTRVTHLSFQREGAGVDRWKLKLHCESGQQKTELQILTPFACFKTTSRVVQGSLE